MADKSKISWTDATWNPITGCSKVSQGCKNCYAKRNWNRLSANPKTVYYGREFENVMCHPERLGQPLRWKKPRKIFVNSMSDLFHEDVPFEFIASVFAIMSVTTRHTYQVLTKRPERMVEFFKWMLDGMDPEVSFLLDDRISENWPKDVPWEGYDNCGPIFPYENVWLGVSVEDQETANERIPLLLNTPAAMRWASVEPLLGPIDIDNIEYPAGDFFNALSLEEWTGLEDSPEVQASPGSGALIDWVVVGGESGPKARPFNTEWAHSIIQQCQAASVPCFMKQLGGHVIQGGERRIKKHRSGADMSEWPHELRITQYPLMENKS